MRRLRIIDMIKSLAIAMMVLFHTNYILREIFLLNTLNFSESFWLVFGKIGGFLFIFLSGFSFYLASEKYHNSLFKKYSKYILKLSVLAFLISIITYFFIPEQIILFGIIHFFTLSFLIMTLIYKLGYKTLILGIFIFILSFFIPETIESRNLFFLGFTYDGFYSADYYPIIPYLSYMIFGFNMAKYMSDKNLLEYLKGRDLKIFEIFSFISKNSLVIYVIHTPIIYSIIYIGLKLLN